jgi:putative ABC transport system substrate-binding protein
MVPRAKTIAVLLNPIGPLKDTQSKEVLEAAHALGLQLEVQHVSEERDLEPAFANFARVGAGALLVVSDPFLNAKRKRIIASAERQVLPAIYEWREFAQAGGLMSYGTSVTETFRQVGVYTGQILKGAKPSDLPVLQATKFEFVINLKTAKTLGLEVPPSLLARADEVIE